MKASSSEQNTCPEVAPIVQRVLGALVLLAMALIVIPALFDFSGHDMPPIKEDLIPEKPANLRVEVLPLPGQEAIVVPHERIRQQLAEQLPPLSPELAPSETARPASSRPAAASKKKPLASSTPVGQKTAKPATAAPSPRWALQVGSFGRRDNARRLLQRIEKAGFSGFLEQSTTKGGAKMVRVLVGPTASRRQAEELRRQLLKKLRLKGLVVSAEGK